MMKIETYNAYNPAARVQINLSENIQQFFARTDQIIKHLKEIKPDKVLDYISALQKRLTDVVADFSADISSFGLKKMTQDLKELKDHLDLQNLILQYAVKHLDLPRGFQEGPEKIEVLSLNWIKTHERLSYQRTKACADVLGDEQGIQLWKEIVARLLEDDKIHYYETIQEVIRQGKTLPTSAEFRERNIEQWTKIGMVDFTVAILDDDKTLYRFDRCLTHEALRDLHDPDFAYLCSCYIGDAEGRNFKSRYQYLRRTQTLHHGDFCDELYWDPKVHNEPEQPSLAFTRNLGREYLSKTSKNS